MDKLSFLSSVHNTFLEGLYEKYIKDPESLNSQWKYFFKGYDFASKAFIPEEEFSIEQKKEFKVIDLISAYRSYIILPK